MSQELLFRQLGSSDLRVSAVGFGCWPIAGISSLDVHPAASLLTIEAALACGINFFDTAYSYGYAGESDELLKKALADRQDIYIASKVGTHYDAQRARIIDGRPQTIVRHTEESVLRLGREHIDLLYLHTPDPLVPIEESAGAIGELVARGICRYAGVSNVDLPQLARFHQTCPIVAVQNPYNMLQQSGWLEIRDYCRVQGISCVAYWVLMKGLLAGKMQRDHQFDPRDRRLSYEIYQGQQWHRAQDLLDILRAQSRHLGCTVSQLVVAWTLQRTGIDVALCGAKRPEQILESSQAMRLTITDSGCQAIEQWLTQLAMT